MTDKHKRVVVNTSPWIALSACEQTALLKKLYDEIYMPYGVMVKLLYELEKGEAEVIILAKEKGINHVLIDEKVARLQAKILGLEVIGTLGLLLKAKKQGLLSSIKPLIVKMLEHGIWIKEDIVKGILKEAEEE